VPLADQLPRQRRNHNGPIQGEARQFKAVQAFLENVRAAAKKLEARLPPGAFHFYMACSCEAKVHHSALYTVQSRQIAVRALLAMLCLRDVHKEA
jgi:hypothetical protein